MYSFYLRVCGEGICYFTALNFPVTVGDFLGEIVESSVLSAFIIHPPDVVVWVVGAGVAGDSFCFTGGE